MKIDWFTVIAQVVNFLVLLAILKFLLFNRIVAAIDERKKRIAAEQEDAARQRREAEADREVAASVRKEIEDAREQRFREAREAAVETRRALEEEMQQEIHQKRMRLQASFEDERRQIISELASTATAAVGSVARQALADLAGQELDERIVTRLIASLRNADEQQRAELQTAWAGRDEPLTVVCSRELSSAEREDLEEALNVVGVEAANVQYQVSDELMAGLEIRGSGRSLGWSLRSYISDVEDQLDAQLDKEAEREAETVETQAQHAESEPAGSPQPRGQEHPDARG